MGDGGRRTAGPYLIFFTMRASSAALRRPLPVLFRLSRLLGVLFPLLTAAALSGCASGGGAPRPTAQESGALIAAFSGVWTLDETSSSPQIDNPFEGMKEEMPTSDIARNESREMRRYRRMLEARRMTVSARRATVEVLRRRPKSLVIRTDGTSLELRGTPGRPLFLPLNGDEAEWAVEEEEVRSRLDWDHPFLIVQHQVVGGGRVRETLEAVGDRLIATREFLLGAESQPLVLAYNRAEGTQR